MNPGIVNAFRKFSKNIRIFIIGLLLLGFLLIVAMVAAPGIAKNYIHKHGKELAGREVHIDKLRYNYFTSTLQINDGLMDFSDQTMCEEFNYELSKITVDMDTFLLHDDWVNINANKKLNKRGL
jgi:hypothetical protein